MKGDSRRRVNADPGLWIVLRASVTPW